MKNIKMKNIKMKNIKNIKIKNIKIKNLLLLNLIFSTLLGVFIYQIAFYLDNKETILETESQRNQEIVYSDEYVKNEDDQFTIDYSSATSENGTNEVKKYRWWNQNENIETQYGNVPPGMISEFDYPSSEERGVYDTFAYDLTHSIIPNPEDDDCNDCGSYLYFFNEETNGEGSSMMNSIYKPEFIITFPPEINHVQEMTLTFYIKDIYDRYYASTYGPTDPNYNYSLEDDVVVLSYEDENPENSITTTSKRHQMYVGDDNSIKTLNVYDSNGGNENSITTTKESGGKNNFNYGVVTHSWEEQHAELNGLLPINNLPYGSEGINNTNYSSGRKKDPDTHIIGEYFLYHVGGEYVDNPTGESDQIIIYSDYQQHQFDRNYSNDHEIIMTNQIYIEGTFLTDSTNIENIKLAEEVKDVNPDNPDENIVISPTDVNVFDEIMKKDENGNPVYYSSIEDPSGNSNFIGYQFNNSLI